jgi:hypothetical protein
MASNVVVELVAGDPCLCRRPEGNTASRFTPGLHRECAHNTTRASARLSPSYIAT